MLIDLTQVYLEAASYISRFHSIQQFDRREVNPSSMLERIRRHASKFVEAVVLLHIKKNMSMAKLSDVLGIKLTNNDMEIIAGFYIQEEINNGLRSGNFILSARQIVRRAKMESYSYMEGVQSLEMWDKVYNLDDSF